MPPGRDAGTVTPRRTTGARSTASLVEVAMTEATIADLLAFIDAAIRLRRGAGSPPVNGR
jgi:hypothetical protein